MGVLFVGSLGFYGFRRCYPGEMGGQRFATAQAEVFEAADPARTMPKSTRNAGYFMWR